MFGGAYFAYAEFGGAIAQPSVDINPTVQYYTDVYITQNTQYTDVYTN